MKISGIICEYNPLHNGHLYHLEQVRRGGAEGIVAVMSGNFVQRGDAALLDKFTRARLAIEGGVDLVLELPVPYALAPAENFAMGGVALLTALGNVQEISFGSECGDIHLLSQAAQACQVCKTDYADVMDDFLRSGYSYPEVLSQMVGQLYGEETAAVLRSPNNTLAIAYLNAIEEMDSPLQPMTIPRKGAGHNSSQPAPDGTASATYIRQFFAEGGDCRRMMPSYAWHAPREAKQNGHIASMEYLERLILYKLRTTDADDLHDIAEIGQGLEHRLYKAKRSALAAHRLIAPEKDVVHHRQQDQHKRHSGGDDPSGAAELLFLCCPPEFLRIFGSDAVSFFQICRCREKRHGKFLCRRGRLFFRLLLCRRLLGTGQDLTAFRTDHGTFGGFISTVFTFHCCSLLLAANCHCP